MFEWYFELRNIFAGTYTESIILNFVELLVVVVPYFVVSVIINAIIRQYFIHKKFKYVSRFKFINILGASIIGIISPIPTYIAVPLGISFLYGGVPFCAVVAFMIASPLMNPGIFFLTLSELGIKIACARVVTTLILSISGGFIAGWVFNSPMVRISEKYKNYQLPEEKSFFSESWRSLRFFSRYFLVALFISAAVKAFISPEFITKMLGNNASMSIVAAITLGVPFYSCGGAAIPFVEVLSEMGMNKGAILAFFISGPSTKLETLYIYKSVFSGYGILAFYLLVTLMGAFFSGLIFFFL